MFHHSDKYVTTMYTLKHNDLLQCSITLKNIKTAEVHIVSKHTNSTEKKSPILTYISCFRTLDINVSKSSINEGEKQETPMVTCIF